MHINCTKGICEHIKSVSTEITYVVIFIVAFTTVIVLGKEKI
jgi:hypothetical protein